MTAYAACTLHVSHKEQFRSRLESACGKSYPYRSDVGCRIHLRICYADGAWHDIAIPLSAWNATCDLSNVDYFLGVSMAPYVAGESVVMDNIYWTLPAAAPPLLLYQEVGEEVGKVGNTIRPGFPRAGPRFRHSKWFLQSPAVSAGLSYLSIRRFLQNPCRPHVPAFMNPVSWQYVPSPR